MSGNTNQPPEGSERDHSELEWESIRQALRGLQFGTVNIIVQDGVVVQIERTDKRRLRLPSAGGNNNKQACR